jgi:transcriptional regulator with XRE-family HTH domain
VFAGIRGWRYRTRWIWPSIACEVLLAVPTTVVLVFAVLAADGSFLIRKDPPVPPLSPRRARLAARLREVRAAAFSSGSELARRLGWQQSRVSKMETGKQLPTEQDIQLWVAACGAADPVAAELRGLLTSARIEYVTHRDEALARGGIAGLDVQVGVLEAQATHIAEWQPGMIPGLVQTAGYATELLARPGRPTMTEDAAGQAAAVAAARTKRQDSLYQPGRRIEVIVGEAALRSAPGTVQTLLGQLDRLVSLSELPTVELRVVPFPAMPVMPLSGFRVHDDHVVFIETLTGEQQLSDPQEVAVYVTALELLRAAGATGPDAVALIRRVAAELRPGAG